MLPRTIKEPWELLTGKTFRLKAGVLGIMAVDGHRTAIQVPAGAIVKVVAGPLDDHHKMADILWEGKDMTMFAQDVVDRGDEIAGR